MIFKKFWYTAIFYLVGIILLTAIGVYVLFNTYFWLTAFWVFIMGLILIVLFLSFIGKEYKKLAYFLVSVDQNDFTPPYSKNFQDLDLNKAFEHLSRVIVSLRDEAQINFQYLQSIVNNISIAVLCVDDEDKIILSNNAAKKLFQKNVLRNINSLKGSSPDLPDIIMHLRNSEKELIKFKINGELFNYTVQQATFKIHRKVFRLFSFQNIQSELEQKELESWQKLTRVMAHEIMNSSIPISNLSGIVYKKLFDKNDQFLRKIDGEQINDIKEGLQTIESRSKGLVNFVEATRNFTKMPTPDLGKVNISDLIRQVALLLNQKILEKSIDLEMSVSKEDISIIADKTLVEQALINLILNAIDAVDNVSKPKIDIDVFGNEQGRTLVAIKDNGKGIPEEDLENIFIPFYTTKRYGSGIGLSMTRQIMYLHKGNISVKSESGLGTTFIISF